MKMKTISELYTKADTSVKEIEPQIIIDTPLERFLVKTSGYSRIDKDAPIPQEFAKSLLSEYKDECIVELRYKKNEFAIKTTNNKFILLSDSFSSQTNDTVHFLNASYGNGYFVYKFENMPIWSNEIETTTATNTNTTEQAITNSSNNNEDVLSLFSTLSIGLTVLIHVSLIAICVQLTYIDSPFLYISEQIESMKNARALLPLIFSSSIPYFLAVLAKNRNEKVAQSKIALNLSLTLFLWIVALPITVICIILIRLALEIPSGSFF